MAKVLDPNAARLHVTAVKGGVALVHTDGAEGDHPLRVLPLDYAVQCDRFTVDDPAGLGVRVLNVLHDADNWGVSWMMDYSAANALAGALNKVVHRRKQWLVATKAIFDSRTPGEA